MFLLRSQTQSAIPGRAGTGKGGKGGTLVEHVWLALHLLWHCQILQLLEKLHSNMAAEMHRGKLLFDHHREIFSATASFFNEKSFV